jgi:hypothetical protein
MKRGIVALVFAAACAGIAEPGDLAVEVLVPSTVVLPPSGSAEVPFTINNHSEQSIFLTTCGDQITLTVERFDGNGWVEHSGNICQAFLLSIPLEIQAGGTADGSVGVSGAGRFRLRPSFALSQQAAAGPGRPSREIVIHGQ